MANERIQIEVVDKIGPDIADKITQIANACLTAAPQVDALSKAMKAMGVTKLGELKTAADSAEKLATSLAKVEAAQAKAKSAVEKANQEAAKTLKLETELEIVENRRIETSKKAAAAKNVEATSQQKLAAATRDNASAMLRQQTAAANLATANNNRATSAQRLTNEIVREGTALNQQAASATRARTALEMLAAAGVRTRTAMETLSAAESRAAKASTEAYTAGIRRATATNVFKGSLERLRVQMLKNIQTQDRMFGSKTLNSIKSYTQMIAGMQMLNLMPTDIAGALDSYTELANKLTIVSTGVEHSSALMKELGDIANRTRSPLESTVKSFARFDLAMKDLGMSQTEVLQVTETINKALILGGATSTESSAALLQLSQAFNKGKLDGEEFKSVMELMPIAADAFAKQLGVTRGELLKLAPEGKITTDVMAKGFKAALEGVNRDFARTIPTIGQGFTVLKTSAILLWGEFNKGVGISATLAKSIVWLSLNLDTLAKSLVVVGVAAAVLYSPQMLAGLATATKALGGFVLFLAANPVLAMTAAIAALVTWMFVFGDTVQVGTDKLVTLKDYAVGTWTIIKQATVGYIELLKIEMLTIWDKIKKKMNSWYLASRDYFSLTVEFAAYTSNQIIKVFVVAYQMIQDVWDNFPLFMDTIFLSATNYAIDRTEDMLKLIKRMTPAGWMFGTDNVNLDALRPRTGYNGNTFDDTQRFVNDVVTKAKATFVRDTDFVKELGDAFKEGAADVGKAVRDSMKPIKDALDEEAKRASNRRIAEEKSAFDLSGQRQRVTPNPEDEKASQNKRSARSLESDIEEKMLRERFIQGMRSQLGNFTLTTKDCALTIRKGAEVKGLDFGVTSNPVDAWQVRKYAPGEALTGRGFANSFFGEDVAKFVKRDQVKEGDLVALRKNIDGYITHVAAVSKVFEDGRIKIIHASNSAGVPGRNQKVVEVDLDSNFKASEILGFATPKALLGKKTDAEKQAEKDAKKGQRKEESRLVTMQRINAELDNEIARLKMLGPEKEAQEKFDAIQEKLITRRIQLTAKEAEAIKAKIATIQEVQRYQSVYEGIYQQAMNQEQDYLNVVKAANQLHKEGVISLEKKNQIVREADQGYIDLIDPMSKHREALLEEMHLLKLTSREREIEIGLIEYRKLLASSGATSQEISKEVEARRTLLVTMRDLKEARQAEDSLLADSVEKRRQVSQQIQAIAKLSSDPSSGFTAGDKAQSVDNILKGMGVDTTYLKVGLDAQLEVWKNYQAQLDELMSERLISERVYANASMQIEMQRQNVFLNSVGSFFGNLSALQKSENKKMAAIGKAAAIAQAMIQTYQAATAAYASLAGIPIVGPALGAAAAAAAIAAGLANVQQIRSQNTGFKSGGFTGNMPTNKVAGVVHGGEFVMNAQATRRIGVDNLYALQNGNAGPGLQTGPNVGSPSTQQNEPTQQATPVVNVPIQAIVVSNRQAALDALKSPEGKTIMLETIEDNKSSVARILGG